MSNMELSLIYLYQELETRPHEDLFINVHSRLFGSHKLKNGMHVHQRMKYSILIKWILFSHKMK